MFQRFFWDPKLKFSPIRKKVEFHRKNSYFRISTKNIYRVKYTFFVFIYRRLKVISNPPTNSTLETHTPHSVFWVGWGPVWGRFSIKLRSVWYRFGLAWTRFGSVQGKFGIFLGSVWDPFGIGVGSVWDGFGVDLGTF